MTFDIGLDEVCVRVGGLSGVITKFSRMDSLPNFVTHGAPLHCNGWFGPFDAMSFLKSKLFVIYFSKM